MSGTEDAHFNGRVGAPRPSPKKSPPAPAPEELRSQRGAHAARSSPPVSSATLSSVTPRRQTYQPSSTEPTTGRRPVFFSFVQSLFLICDART